MALTIPTNLKWIEKDTEFSALSDEDKQFVIETLGKVPPAQLSQMAQAYGANLGVFKPYSQWTDNDIISMYAQRYGSVEKGTKKFIQEYGHLSGGFPYNTGTLGGRDYSSTMRTTPGFGEDALANAIKNFKTYNQDNKSDRIVNLGNGWYDTVTGKFYDAPNITEYEGAPPIADVRNYTPELMTAITSTPTYYAPNLNLDELLGTGTTKTDTATTTTPTTASTAQLPSGADRAALDAQVTASFQKNMGRNPTQAELDKYTPQLAKGENVNLAIANLPESSAYGTRPTYGSDQAGIKMPTVPNLASIAMPTVPTFTNFGDKIGNMTMPTYGTDQAGLGLAKYGDTVGGVSPVSYGDQIAGLGVLKYGDAVGNATPIKYGDAVGNAKPYAYGDEIAGLGLTKYGDTVAGYNPIKYGDSVNGIDFQRYGSTIAGQNIPDYAKLVSDPVAAWRFENTDAYNAKKTIMMNELNNQLAARGSLRGAPAVNYLTDQTRRLYSDSYDAERQWYVNQRTAEYQARGLAYADAYAAATNEYNTAYNAENTAYKSALENAQNQYNTAYTGENTRYNTAYTGENDRYNQALAGSVNQYNTAYNAANDKYNTALTNNQNQYNTAYTSNLANYQTAINSTNANAGERYNLLYGQYGQNVQNALNQYNLGIGAYTTAFNANSALADAAYNELLNAAKIGQAAVGGTTAAGTTAAGNSSTAIGNAATSSANTAVTNGLAQSSLYAGLGNVIPSAVSIWKDTNSLFNPSTTTNTSTDKKSKGISAYSKTTSPTLQKGLGMVNTTTPTTKSTTSKYYDPNTSYSFNIG